MIDGLKIDVPSSELKEMLLGRLKYHGDKVEAYESQERELAKIEATLGEEAKRLGKTSNATPMDNIHEAIKRHKNQVVYYDFMAKHVVANETYRLNENDLVRLGVQAQFSY